MKDVSCENKKGTLLSNREEIPENDNHEDCQEDEVNQEIENVEGSEENSHKEFEGQRITTGTRLLRCSDGGERAHFL